MTEMQITVSVPVDVSRETLGLWVAGMLNTPNFDAKWTGFTKEEENDLAILDEMDGDVDVTWEAADVRS